MRHCQIGRIHRSICDCQTDTSPIRWGSGTERSRPFEMSSACGRDPSLILMTRNSAENFFRAAININDPEINCGQFAGPEIPRTLDMSCVAIDLTSNIKIFVALLNATPLLVWNEAININCTQTPLRHRFLGTRDRPCKCPSRNSSRTWSKPPYTSNAASLTRIPSWGTHQSQGRSPHAHTQGTHA